MNNTEQIFTDIIVLGSGAAGLNAAIQLHQLGMTDFIIVSEGLDYGTSINTGSDKQTYYKLSLCDQPDSPDLMAQSYFSGGSTHGDLALVEAAGSVRGFMNLVNLGVPFPHDSLGRYIGYKTDHDPYRRATSVGPYTSREMCRALIAQLKRLQIRLDAPWTVIDLITESQPESADKKIVGLMAVNDQGILRVYKCNNLIFAVGGPAGIYYNSVYPVKQLGAIGLALKAGAIAEGLPESQFGLASVSPRWNVSGTYMQVIPRFVSASVDEKGNPTESPTEFLGKYYDEPTKMFSDIFRKGYQWPFDSRKVPDGSSMIDLYVYRETVERKKRVWLDFTANPTGFSFDLLDSEAKTYLEKSQALLESPIARLRRMNPKAIELYKDFGIDISTQKLEIALCAQHNNGGLAVDIWYRSNIKGLFPIGEVAGTHGVARPGGSALNAGQVASLRAAEYIAHQNSGQNQNGLIPSSRQISEINNLNINSSVDFWTDWFEKCRCAPSDWKSERIEFQKRMSTYGAAIRSSAQLPDAIQQAKSQYFRLLQNGCRFDSSKPNAAAKAAANLHLCLSHWIYLESIFAAVESSVGSRGSSLIVAPRPIPQKTTFVPGINANKEDENPDFRAKILQTQLDDTTNTVSNHWIPCRPIPTSETWFETDWQKFRTGEIFS